MKGIKTQFGFWLPSQVPIGAVNYRVVSAPIAAKGDYAKTLPRQLKIVFDLAKFKTYEELRQAYQEEVDHAIEFELEGDRRHSLLKAKSHMRVQAQLALEDAQRSDVRLRRKR
jgi:hypothetical protein